MMPKYQEERKKLVKALELKYQFSWNATLAVFENEKW